MFSIPFRQLFGILRFKKNAAESNHAFHAYSLPGEARFGNTLLEQTAEIHSGPR